MIVGGETLLITLIAEILGYVSQKNNNSNSIQYIYIYIYIYIYVFIRRHMLNAIYFND